MLKATRPALILLASATLAQLGSSAVLQGVSVLAVFLRPALHLSLTAMGSLTAAIAVGTMLGLLLWGSLVDRWGPRRLMVFGLPAVVLVALWLASGLSFLLLVAGLALLGVALAAIPSGGSRAIFETFPGAQRGTAMGIRQAGVPLGAALSAAVIPLLAPALGPFPVFAVMAGLIALFGMPFLFLSPKRAMIHTVGARLGELVPAIPVWALGTVLAAGQYVPVAFLIVDLHDRLAFSLVTAGLALAVVQVAGAVTRVGLGRLSDQRPHHRYPYVAAAALLAALSAASLAAMGAGTPSWLPFVAAAGLGAGGAGWNALQLTWAGERVPPNRAGQSMSWCGAAVFLGAAIFPPLAGFVSDHTGSFVLMWIGLAGLLAVASAATWWVGSAEGSSLRPPLAGDAP
ncbi:MAG: MFS transporter [Sulfobacillus sp.]